MDMNREKTLIGLLMVVTGDGFWPNATHMYRAKHDKCGYAFAGDAVKQN